MTRLAALHAHDAGPWPEAAQLLFDRSAQAHLRSISALARMPSTCHDDLRAKAQALLGSEDPEDPALGLSLAQDVLNLQ